MASNHPAMLYRCWSCHESLPREAFFPKLKRFQSQCRACDRKKQGTVNARHAALVREAKSKPCQDCGVTYPYYVMDLDHRPGEKKEFMLSQWARNIGRVQAELAKCDTVCSNCHRERTQQRKQWGTKGQASRRDPLKPIPELGADFSQPLPFARAECSS